MNAYTLDPPKAESTAASAPPAAPVTAPVPIYMPPTYQYYPHQYPQASPKLQSDINKIRDWLPWSIVSLFVGGLIPGFLPLVFTLICRSNKKNNEIDSARKMSTLALVFNIIITIIGVAVLIGLFIYLVVFTDVFKRGDYIIF